MKIYKAKRYVNILELILQKLFCIYNWLLYFKSNSIAGSNYNKRFQSPC